MIGLHGGNILSIDVLSGGGDLAVDDLVVDFHGELDLGDLVDDLATNAGTTLMSIQPAEVGDLIERTLRVASLLVRNVTVDRPVEGGERGGDRPGARNASGKAAAASQSDRSEAFCTALKGLTGSSAAWVSTSQEAGSFPAGMRALQTGRPSAARSPSVPSNLADLPPGEASLLAVPGPNGAPVVFLARIAPNDFTATEVARVEALSSLYAEILQRL